jgi:hypothetical protein
VFKCYNHQLVRNTVHAVGGNCGSLPSNCISKWTEQHGQRSAFPIVWRRPLRVPITRVCSMRPGTCRATVNSGLFAICDLAVCYKRSVISLPRIPVTPSLVVHSSVGWPRTQSASHCSRQCSRYLATTLLQPPSFSAACLHRPVPVWTLLQCEQRFRRLMLLGLPTRCLLACLITSLLGTVRQLALVAPASAMAPW